MTPVRRTDAEIQQDVLDEIDWDPEVEVTDVGVEVDDGVVTLTGTVDTFSVKWAAGRAALRVAEVRAVANDIEVRPARTDTDIARAVADALERAGGTPLDHVDVRVESGGRVVLEGEADRPEQFQVAEDAARSVPGITSLANRIRIRHLRHR